MIRSLFEDIIIAIEVCRTIKGVELDIRNTPGTALMNDAGAST